MENDMPLAFTDDAIRAALDRADADVAAGRVVSAQRARELLSGEDGLSARPLVRDGARKSFLLLFYKKEELGGRIVACVAGVMGCESAPHPTD